MTGKSRGHHDFVIRTRFPPQSTLQASDVTVYTRVQCCCCHKALDLLKDFQRGHGFQITEVDIDADAELVAKYGNEVPVVAVNGKVRFRGVVNPDCWNGC